MLEFNSAFLYMEPRYGIRIFLDITFQTANNIENLWEPSVMGNSTSTIHFSFSARQHGMLIQQSAALPIQAPNCLRNKTEDRQMEIFFFNVTFYPDWKLRFSICRERAFSHFISGLDGHLPCQRQNWKTTQVRHGKLWSTELTTFLPKEQTKMYSY